MEKIDNEVFYSDHEKMIISNIIDDYDNKEIRGWLDSLIKDKIISRSDMYYYIQIGKRDEAVKLLKDNNCFDTEMLDIIKSYNDDPLGFYGMKDSDFLSY